MKLAVGPSDSTASVAFLVGGSGWGDGFLAQGLTWCKAIQRAAGGAPGVQVAQLPAQTSAMPAIVDKLGRASLTAQLSNDVLDQRLGGLRGHSLVIVTHGLEADGVGPAASSQGILLYNRVKGESPLDVMLWTDHLELMTTRARPSGLPEDADVVPSAAVAQIEQTADGKRMQQQVRELAQLVNALRQSPYQRIYLAACGGEHRLERLARKLSVLTLKSLYFNLATISFPKPPTPPAAAVGALHGDDVIVEKGTRFFRSADDPANQVLLQTGTSDFLAGSQGRSL